MTLSQSQRGRKLLLLFLAGGALVCASSPRSQDLSHALSSPGVTGWTLADFDGDNSFDLATASSARHDARGYSQEVRVSLGARQQSSFKFRSRSATVDLSTTDIDGDHDRDLVVREPLSMTPIGVWLNDGTGSFHEGNLADFPELSRRSTSAAWRVRPQRNFLVGVSEERISLAVPDTSKAPPRHVGAHPICGTDPSPRGPRNSGIRNRAPPRSACF